jgi:hypothetical protein
MWRLADRSHIKRPTSATSAASFDAGASIDAPLPGRNTLGD